MKCFFFNFDVAHNIEPQKCRLRCEKYTFGKILTEDSYWTRQEIVDKKV